MTDRRQTDGRTTTYSEHEHEFTFAKNALISTQRRGLFPLSESAKRFRSAKVSHAIY